MMRKYSNGLSILGVSKGLAFYKAIYFKKGKEKKKKKEV